MCYEGIQPYCCFGCYVLEMLEILNSDGVLNTDNHVIYITVSLFSGRNEFCFVFVFFYIKGAFGTLLKWFQVLLRVFQKEVVRTKSVLQTPLFSR